jgi:uncharacterized protein (TIGR02117 family)
MTIGKWLRKIGISISAIIGLYMIAALIGSLIARNAGWQEPAERITIYVVSNGYHSGLVLPVAAGGEDWSLIVQPTDLPGPGFAGNYLLFGWGDRDFYLNTPSLSDITPGTALGALIGSGKTLVHVDHLMSPSDLEDPRPIRLSPAAYTRLTRYIRTSIKRGSDGHPVTIAGYDVSDVFYEARGHYNAVVTCNVWTSNALAAAGVRTGLWTPLSVGVMWWHKSEPAGAKRFNQSGSR